MEPGMETAERLPKRARSRKTRTIIAFAAIWLLLASGGLTGAVYYVEQLKVQWTQEISEQTAVQIAESEARNRAELQRFEKEAEAELAKLGEQVQAINELLTFIKDHSSDKSDNSNQLYTQLSEIQAQLNQLKKNLDVLK